MSATITSLALPPILCVSGPVIIAAEQAINKYTARKKYKKANSHVSNDIKNVLQPLYNVCQPAPTAKNWMILL